MEKDRIKYLYSRYIAETCTPAEAEELQLFLRDAAHEERFRKLLDETWLELKDSELTDLTPEKAASLLHDVTAHSQNKNTIRRMPLWLRIAAAAIIAITLATGLFYYLSPKKETPHLADVGFSAMPDVEPGTNKAVLTLADGQKIGLSSEHDGIIIRADELVYNDGSEVIENGKLKAEHYAVLTTPKGGQYQVVLPDGTDVWLNAGSSLKYPMRFAAEKREVELKGEAYFEVVKAKSAPFIVKTAMQEVEVLGTRFNISAYEDEEVVKTTLAEGSIRVRRQVNNSRQNVSLVLKPGQQATVRPGAAAIRLSSVNIAEIMAWKDGLFIFNNENIKSIMKRLSRWYDMEVVYQGNMEDIQFLGNYSRNKNLRNLLKNMELTGKVHFKIEENGTERRIIVIAD